MSIIVGISTGKRKKIRVMGSDNRESDDNGHKFDHARKLFKLRTGLFGFSGDSDLENKLKILLSGIDDPTKSEVRVPKGEYNAIFMSRSGRSFNICDGSATEFPKSEHVMCAGFASAYAYGAIHGYCKAKKWKIDKLSQKHVILLVRLGCQTAIDFNNTCGGRVHVKTLEVA